MIADEPEKPVKDKTANLFRRVVKNTLMRRKN